MITIYKCYHHPLANLSIVGAYLNSKEENFKMLFRNKTHLDQNDCGSICVY